MIDTIKTIKKRILTRTTTKTYDVLGYKAGSINAPQFNHTEVMWVLTNEDKEKAFELLQGSFKTIMDYSDAYKSSELTHWNKKGFLRDSLNQESNLQELKNKVFEIIVYRGEEVLFLGCSSKGEIILKEKPRDNSGQIISAKNTNFTHIKIKRQ
ncbi:hypothetical protein PXQ59_002173 [Vibrio parahaemolyticus]|nr:hypothetical protein [Vibrio parahaemolyticus]